MAKYLIVNGDDFGMCHSANLAIKELFEAGRIQSSTVITTSCWAKEAINMIKEQPELMRVGCHITHTSEWENFRWGGFLDIPELQDEDRKFPKKTEDAWKAPIELRLLEAKAQIQWMLDEGIEITHIDNHMFTCDDDRTKLYDLAKENNWGCRPAYIKVDDEYLNNYLKNNGIDAPDYLNVDDGECPSDRETYESHKANYIHMLRIMPDGINEWATHPAIESDELKAVAPDWKVRVFDHRFFMSDEFIQVCKEENITLIGYEDIKNIRRK